MMLFFFSEARANNIVIAMYCMYVSIISIAENRCEPRLEED